VDTLDKGMIHILGEMKRYTIRFHHTTQDGIKFLTYEVFIYGIFHLIFLNRSLSQVTKTEECENTGKGVLLYYPGR
jgi:hypothetical protein